MPTITHPVSRDLAVTDLARSLAFYKDVLDFDVSSGQEAICGAARLFLHTGSHPPTGGMIEEGPPGAATVLLETDDLDAMWTKLSERGAQPTPPEKVNWIKIRYFEVRDPDGHRLGCSRSYQMPDMPPPVFMQLRRALPELPCTDVPAAVAYYQEVLGFKINYAQGDLGVMDRDKITVLLIARTPEHTGIGSSYFYVENADILHAELTSRGARALGTPVSYPWGLRSFSVVDLEGNRLSFAQTFE